MWFIFPQLKGLGRSETAQRFSLPSAMAAAAYLRHPVLGDRLREATRTVLLHSSTATAHDIFGSPDDLKFGSCMTLFAHASPGDPLFVQALEAFYGGAEDPETLNRL